MAIKVVNKSRQALPLTIVKDGKEVQKMLLASGEHSSVESEGVTTIMRNLEERSMVAIRQVEEKVVANVEPKVEPVIEPKAEPINERKYDKKGNKK